MSLDWTACSWRVAGWADPISEPTIDSVHQIDGPDRYAVRYRGRCLNHAGEWELEPMPSSRDESFLARCRFSTREDAIAAAAKPIGLLLADLRRNYP